MRVSRARRLPEAQTVAATRPRPDALRDATRCGSRQRRRPPGCRRMRRTPPGRSSTPPRRRKQSPAAGVPPQPGCRARLGRCCRRGVVAQADLQPKSACRPVVGMTFAAARCRTRVRDRGGPSRPPGRETPQPALDRSWGSPPWMRVLGAARDHGSGGFLARRSSGTSLPRNGPRWRGGMLRPRGMIAWVAARVEVYDGAGGSSRTWCSVPRERRSHTGEELIFGGSAG